MPAGLERGARWPSLGAGPLEPQPDAHLRVGRAGGLAESTPLSKEPRQVEVRERQGPDGHAHCSDHWG